MVDLAYVFNAMFKNRVNWKKITDEDKEKFFFIFNRYFSKKYPDKAQLLNLKTIDKTSAFDLWYYFMLDKPYPNWFWSKSSKIEKNKISDKYYKILLKKLNIKNIDLDYLIEHHFDFIKSELNDFN
jgi:hypothetical protein